MRIKNLDLLLAIAIALLNLLWATQTSRHPQIIGILLALPQVFFLPGYTLVEILFHRRPLENIRRCVLSISVSISIIILSGLGLSDSPWGLTTRSWAIFLTSIIVLFALVAMLMRTVARIIVIRKKQLVQIAHTLRKHPISLGLGAIAIGLMILSIVYSSASVTNERRQGFTQLWLIQTNPTTKSCSVLIGIDSFEFKPLKYRVFVTTKGALTSTWSSPVNLSPQKTWKIVHQVDIKKVGDVEIQVQLYQGNVSGKPGWYVHLILHGKKGKNGQEWQCTTL
jgi:uncharacterized membrane protein